MIVADITDLLDQTCEAFASGDVYAGMAHLTPELTRLHDKAGPDQWTQLTESLLRKHPLAAQLSEDPFTNHAFTRPRGYPGDAALIDLIYDPRAFPMGASALGKEIARYSLSVPETVAVRERRAVLATLVDEASHAHHHPQVLCVAAGHCRELDLSQAVAQGVFKNGGRFIAFDQDPVSMNEVARLWSASGVVTHTNSIRSILSEKYDEGRFDLIYAAGLYDYVSHRTAVRLTAALFKMLNPGGRLVIGNFATSGHSIGYMSVFMDWTLIYRDGKTMYSLVEEVPQTQLAACRVFETSNRHVIFVDARKG